MNLDNALLTDLYQLAMLRGYFARDMHELAVFEFFIRKQPSTRNFLVAAGLEQALQFLEEFHFTRDELNWLAQSQNLPVDFVEYLSDLRFTGDVDAMPEGTIFFANEPIIRITAPLPIAQLVETRLINLLQFQTLIASKAARCVLAAPGKTLVDFGFRRAHGSEAGLFAARASYLAGFAGTSTVLAGKVFGIPISGTMAHSFVLAHGNEIQAFQTFARANPENAVFVLDTYNTEEAARKVVTIAPELRQEGIPIKAVRLDSGDLAAHAHAVRKILNDGGLRDTRILASGNLDEHDLQRLSASAPIDGFGVGTRLDTSADCPSFDCAYKLQEYAGKACRKKSESKETWPGRKQVFRQFDENQRMVDDVLTIAGDSQPGIPLLIPFVRGGKRVNASETLAQIRERVSAELERLPKELRSLQPASAYRVRVSDSLRTLTKRVDEARESCDRQITR